ncbi:MAG TPA: dTDP-4-dehydrorhamnose 3,5-epimerase family protein [Chloroflexota bacterium]|jgi:dTDP-4-dehydrorhamnose 3,5-epimerase-like enzyme|nr:dTDP-4-dehydrorhamnose 3,5-epimerase family protein [Chloroflexota bacterium]
MGWEEVGRAVRGVRSPVDAPIIRQTYTESGVDPLPDGVLVVQQRVFPDDSGGSFKEVVRLDSNGIVEAPQLRERGIALKPAQLNVSLVAPGARRFWHVHPEQCELWTISHGQLNAGVIDCREGSPSYGKRARVILTSHSGLYIPAGVAHGFANESSALVVLHYLVDHQFSRGEDSQEWRISPEVLDYQFVLAETI